MGCVLAVRREALLQLQHARLVSVAPWPCLLICVLACHELPCTAFLNVPCRSKITVGLICACPQEPSVSGLDADMLAHFHRAG